MDIILYISIAVLVINVLIAYLKGFNPFIWAFAASFISLIVLLVLPSANAVKKDDDLYEKRIQNADFAGKLLIALGLSIVIILSFVFWNFRILISYFSSWVGVFVVFYAISTIANIVTMPMVFLKAKQPWWSCFVPIYNVFALVKIAELPKGWALALILVPITTPILAYLSTLVGISFWIITIIGTLVFLYLLLTTLTEIAGNFDFEPLYAVVCTLFLQGFFFSLIAFSQVDYKGSGNYGIANNYVPRLSE